MNQVRMRLIIQDNIDSYVIYDHHAIVDLAVAGKAFRNLMTETEAFLLMAGIHYLDRERRLHGQGVDDGSSSAALSDGTSDVMLAGEIAQLRNLVNEQAEDAGLWGIHPVGEQPIVEAYLQQELRRLHAAVESVVALADGTGGVA